MSALNFVSGFWHAYFRCYQFHFWFLSLNFDFYFDKLKRSRIFQCQLFGCDIAKKSVKFMSQLSRFEITSLFQIAYVNPILRFLPSSLKNEISNVPNSDLHFICLNLWMSKCLKAWLLRCVPHFDLMFQMFIFTHPSTLETTHVYVENSHVDLRSADAKSFVYNFFKVLRQDKKQSHQPSIVGQQNSLSVTFS